MPGDDELLTALTAAMNASRPEQGALQAANQLPDVMPIGLWSFAIAVTSLAVDGLREQRAREPRVVTEFARMLNNFALRLAETGRRDEALPVSQEAVTLRRELTAANRAAYLPDLARSLTNHAVRLAQTGRRDEALPVSQEAVANYRELTAANRAAYLPDLARSLGNHALQLAEAERREEAEALFDDILSQFRTSSPGVGHLLLARGRWRLGDGRLGEAVPDLAAAVDALTDAGDHMVRGSARQLLRRAREDDREAFDQAWSQVKVPLPGWLQHLQADENLVRVLVAWIEIPDWDASKTHLQDNAVVLLTDQAAAVLEHLIDDNPPDDTLPEHLGLLQAARACGPDAAYAARHDQLLADQAVGILNEWFATRPWEQSRAFASARDDELLHSATTAIIGQLGEQEPRNYVIRLHRGLLSYAATAGFDAAYELIADPEQLGTALAATEEPSEKLALARLHSGQSADDPEAHFHLAVTTLLAGNPGEAAAALADCADHAAPYERRAFSRRLADLSEDHPALAPAIADLQQIFDTRPSAETQ